jgi:hypothetical protein
MNDKQLAEYKQFNQTFTLAAVSDDLELFKTVANFSLDFYEQQNILTNLVKYECPKMFHYYIDNHINEQHKIKIFQHIFLIVKENNKLKNTPLYLYIQNQLRLSKLKQYD